MLRKSLILLVAVSSLAWNRGKAVTFARLPPGTDHPEGLTIDKNGDVYVADFEERKPATANGHVVVFDENGKLLRVLTLPGSSSTLLGLDFHPTTGELLVIDFGHKNVLRVDKHTGANTVFTSATGNAGLNALEFDKQGNVYISDSFQGIIWKTGPAGGAAVPWVQDPLLTTTGTPPFGANGMAFNKAQSALFVANTGDDTLVEIPVVAGNPGKPFIFTNSINGADGVIRDDDDNLWVAANQADEIVVVDKSGKAIAKLGDFDGIKNGEPVGLLFPASPKFRGDFVYVTNLALDIRDFGLPQAVDSQWCAQVRTWTVARIRIKGIPDQDEDRD